MAKVKGKANRKKRLLNKSPNKRGGKNRSIRGGGGRGMGGSSPSKGGGGG